jgi:NTP pyrophosphatase (non-canonical NTP hydrolase)
MNPESGFRIHRSSFIIHHFPMDTPPTIADLQAAVARFVDERNWQVYHTPKSLSMSIAIEAAELMEHFQWHGNGASRQVALQDDVHEAVAGELADVLIYCLALANAAGIDAGQAVLAKLARNRERFPPGDLPSRHRLATNLHPTNQPVYQP